MNNTDIYTFRKGYDTMKRIIGILLAAVMCAFSFNVFAAGTKAANVSEDEVINVIKLLGIANGDENGNMNLDDKVTRAQFIKMAVCASSAKDDATEAKLNVSLFSDVKNIYWGAGYISVGVKNGLINGYLDGTFRPDENVKLEEAVTIALKLLGYTTSDFLGPYPSDQLAKYRTLELNDGISAVQGQALTRKECMRLLYNVLCTKTKSGQIYSATLGYSVNDEGVVDYNALYENKIKGPVVVNGTSDWKKNIPFAVTDKTEAVLSGKNISVKDIRENDVVYYMEAFKSLVVYRKTATGVVLSVNQINNSPSAVNLSGKTYQLLTNSVKNKFSNSGKYGSDKPFVTLLLGMNGICVDAIDGSIDRIADNTDNSTYVEMVNETISKPILVSADDSSSAWKQKIPFDVNGASVFLNGVSAKLSDIKYNDVVYYSEQFNTIWVFRDTQSGVISAAGNDTVMIGGKSYVLATDSAKYKVSAYGEFSENDYVTLILGKDKEVVDIYSANTSDIGNKDNDSSYSEVVSSTLKGPYIIGADRKAEKLPFDIADAVIYKGSSTISSSEIRQYDVYYYSELLKTVWIYRDTVSGTVEAVNPVISPTSVVVAGKTYSIEASQASYDLSSLGTYHVGDDVTLLLGKDGVAGVTSTENISGIVYGVVTDIGQKQFTKSDGMAYTADYVTVTDTSNTALTYEFENKYLPVGSIVRVSFGESVRISKMSTTTGAGVAAMLKNAFYEGKFADDCEIIDTNGSKTVKVYPSRLKGLNLDISEFTFSNIVLFYSLDDSGNITKMILNDFTGDLYDYGVVVTSNSTSTKYMVDSAERIMAIGTKVSEGPACVKNDETLMPMRAYIDVETLTKKAAYDENDKEYLLSNDVKVFIKNIVTYTYADLDEVLSGDYTFKAYYDKKPEQGGRIRVIVATKG